MPAADDDLPPADTLFRSGSAGPRRPPGPWAASLGFHLVLIALLTLGGSPRLRTPEIIEGQKLFAEREHEIVWHTFREKLPATAPLPEPPSRKTNNKAEFRAPQTIVADDPDPQSDRQMIWSPEPAPEIRHAIRSPNLLVWTPPKVARPRFEMDVPKPSGPKKQALRAPAAPDVKASSLASVDLQAIQPPAPVRYRSFDRPAEKPRPQALDRAPAPEIEITRPAFAASVLTLQERSRHRF